MSEENFKVRKGLSVGDDFTVDAATGDLTTTGSITAADIDVASIVTDDIEANVGSDLTLQGDNVILNTLEAGSYDRLLNFNSTGYDFDVSSGYNALLVPDVGTVDPGVTLHVYVWIGDTTAGSNQITNCQIFGVADNFITALDWNTVLSDITGVNAKPALLGNDNNNFLPPNQGINFEVGVKISSVTIDPMNNTVATVTLTTDDGATTANAANTLVGAIGLFSEYVRNTDKTLVQAYSAWDPVNLTYLTPTPGTALYTFNGGGGACNPVIYPTTLVAYQATAYWSHDYSVAPTGYFTGRKRIDLQTTNPINENINVDFGLGIGPNAVSTNRGLPNDGIDALGLSILNDGTLTGFTSKTAVNITQFKDNSFYQGGVPQERGGPYFTFNQFSNNINSGGSDWYPLANDGMGAITWYGRVNANLNLSSVYTPAGIWTKATEDWNGFTAKSGLGMYLQYTPNSAGVQGGRTWAMADDVNTELRAGTTLTLKPIAKSGSQTSVSSVRDLNTTVNHTWLTAEDYSAGNAYTNGTGAKVTVGITSASGNDGDVGLVIERATGNTADFEFKLPIGSGNTLQLVNNATGNVIATFTDANITTESDSYNFKDSAGNSLVTVNSTGDVTVTGEVNTNERFRYGSIRNATADAAGAVARFLNGNFYGESISDSLVSGNRTGIVLRNERSIPAQGLLFEVSKAGAAPTTGTSLGLLAFSGYDGTNWQFDGVSAGSILLQAAATENWTSTACGAAMQVATMPNGYNSLSSLQYNIFQPSGHILVSQSMALNDISTGVGGSGQQYFSIAKNSGGGFTTASITKSDATTGGECAVFDGRTYRSTAGTYSPTQLGDRLGLFRFSGNTSTTTSATPAVALEVEGYATEAWTPTANGSGVRFSVTPQGSVHGGGSVAVIDANPEVTTFKSDLFEFEDMNGTALKGDKIDYRRTFGCWHKIANVTAAAANTVYDFDWTTDVTPHVATQGITVSNTSRLNFDTGGDYEVVVEMQTKNTDNAERIAWIWLAKNGTDITDSRIKVSLRAATSADTYQLITKMWLVEGIAANDYLELRFAVDNNSGISLEYEAAQASPFAMPAQPSATITIIPVGA